MKSLLRGRTTSSGEDASNMNVLVVLKTEALVPRDIALNVLNNKSSNTVTCFGSFQFGLVFDAEQYARWENVTKKFTLNWQLFGVRQNVGCRTMHESSCGVNSQRVQLKEIIFGLLRHTIRFSTCSVITRTAKQSRHIIPLPVLWCQDGLVGVLGENCCRG